MKAIKVQKRKKRVKVKAMKARAISKSSASKNVHASSSESVQMNSYKPAQKGMSVDQAINLIKKFEKLK
jgi:hypothetical protein